MEGFHSSYHSGLCWGELLIRDDSRAGVEGLHSFCHSGLCCGVLLIRDV